MKTQQNGTWMGPAERGEKALRMAIGDFHVNEKTPRLKSCIENKDLFSTKQRAFLQAIEEPLERSSGYFEFLDQVATMCDKNTNRFLDHLEENRLSIASERTFNETLFKLKSPEIGIAFGKFATRLVDGQVSSHEEVEQAIAEITNRSGDLKLKTREPRFKLLDYDDLKSLRGEPYLVDKILVRAQLNEVFGPSGNGKTFFALNIALSVASGQPFLGLSVKQGPVVYIYSEGQGGAPNRVDAYLKYHGLEPEAIKPRFHLIDEAVHLLEATNEQDLCRSIMDNGISPDLIVIDTLVRAFAGKSPDKSDDMGKFVTICENLQRSFDSAVLLVHHSIKSDHMVDSGSNTLRTSTSSVFQLEQKGRAADGQKRLRLKCVKIKDADDKDRVFDLLLQPVLLEPDKNGKEQTSCVITLGSSTPEPPKTMVYLQALVTALEGQDQPGLTSTAWRKACGCAKSTFDGHRRQLVNDGMVVHNGKLYCPTEKGRAALSGD